jgi:FADH2-dependent halogenase
MPDTTYRDTYDVIVIGGGPAGSTAARMLASRGHLVLVLEQAKFPRFHIGESMLTYTAELLERFGLTGELTNQDFPVKTGAEFCDPNGAFRRVDFADQGGGRRQTTFQVERADFDKLLLESAARCGAEVRYGAKVNSVLFEGGRITGVRFTCNGPPKLARAPMVLDASGRAGVIAHQELHSRRTVDRLRMVATFRHFGGIDEATNPGVPGDIQIGSHADGWVWAIPIRWDKLSVGTVTRPAVLSAASSRGALFDEHLRRIPRIYQRCASARALTGLLVDRDFSYYSERVAGAGFLVAGDAGCFVDPIFSAGVYLALTTALRAAELTSDLLSGKTTEDKVIEAYTRFYKTGYDTYFRLIYAFYEYDFKLGRFLKSTGAWVDPRWVARLLGGDFWSRRNALAQHLRTVDRYATFAPFEPMHGCPVYGDLDASEQLPEALGGAIGPPAQPSPGHGQASPSQGGEQPNAGR